MSCAGRAGRAPARVGAPLPVGWLLAVAAGCALAGCGEKGAGAGRAGGDAGTFTLPPLGLDHASTGPSPADLDITSGRVRRARADLERVLASGRPAEGKLACELGLATSAGHVRIR